MGFMTAGLSLTGIGTFFLAAAWVGTAHLRAAGLEIGQQEKETRCMEGRETHLAEGTFWALETGV